LVAFEPSVAGQAVVVGTDGAGRIRADGGISVADKKTPPAGTEGVFALRKILLRRWRAGERRCQVDRDRQGSRSRNARVNVEVEVMERGVVGRVVCHASCQRDNVAVGQSEAMKVLRDRPNRCRRRSG